MPAYNDYLVDQVANSWVKTANATAGTATATAPAPGLNRYNCISKCDVSFSSSTQSGLFQVLFGSTVIAEKFIHGAGALDFGQLGHKTPLPNQAISATLAAGAAGIVGYVVITGYQTA